MNLRLALRATRRNRGLAALIIATMALGIGANATIYSLIRAVFLRPLPFPQPDRIVTMWESDAGAGIAERLVTPANFVDWSEQSRSFESLGALNWDGTDTLFKILSSTGVERVRGVYASSEFFRVLGINPELGRFFTSEEDHRSGLRRAIISHVYWQRRFHADATVVGQTLDVDTYGGGPFTIIGVLPQGSAFPMDAEVWLSYGDAGTRPLPQPDAAVRCCSWLSVFGRLKPGVTISQAEAEMAVIVQRISERHPDTSKLSAVKIVPLRQQMVRGQGVIFLALSGAVAVVLLIACANVANLLLSRAVGREKEMQTRFALGATAWQIAKQLIAESLVLCVLGTAAGLLLAVWAQDALVKIFVDRIPIIATAQIDGSVLLFTAIITLLCGIACGLTPLLYGRAKDWRQRGLTENSRSKRLRHLLVVGELALSLILVSGTGLLMRTVLKLTEVDFGVRRQGVLSVFTDVNTEGLRERENKVEYLDQLIPRLATLPGAIMAAATTALPMDPVNLDRITLEGKPYHTASDSPPILQAAVTPNYFQLMGIPLKEGREFTERDTSKSTLVAVLSETTAQHYWQGEDPIGKRFAIGSLDRFGCFRCDNAPGPEWVEVVGIVGNVRSGGLGSDVLPVVYYSHRQHSIYDPKILIRTSGNPLLLASAVRNEMLALNKRVLITRTLPIDQVISDTASEPRVRASLVGVFAGLALVLGMLGVYGTASHTVTQKTREIGIRMALGARQNEIARMILSGMLRLSLLAVALGFLGFWAIARMLASLLFGIQPLDLLTLILSCGFLVTTTTLASYMPIRRAMRIDPAIALRNE